MSYVLSISDRASEALDEILNNNPDPSLLDAMDRLFDEIADHPVTVIRRHPRMGSHPYAVGYHERSLFLIAFRFLPADQRANRRIEIQAVALMRL